jgi:hypothetical protein
MAKSATDVMHDIIFSAVLDSVAALKVASKGLPNTLLRDLNALHANTTFADMPPELQAAITTSVRSAFTRLLKEGYSVAPGQGDPRSPPPRRDVAGQATRPVRPAPPPRRGPDGPRPPRSPDGPRPPRGPDGPRPPRSGPPTGRKPKPRGS